MTKIYVGNLPFSATEADVRELFAQHGDVQSVQLITDRETNRPRGFGFVEMDDDAAKAAIAALDGSDFEGRALRVNEAREREERGGGSRGGSRGGGFDRGGRGSYSGGRSDRGGSRGSYGDRGGDRGGRSDRGSRGRSDRGGRDQW